VAAILVIFFYPMHQRLLRHFSATRAAVLSTLVVTFLLIVPAILVATLFIREAFPFQGACSITLLVKQAPMLAKSWAWVAQHVPGLDPNADVLEMLAQGVQKTGGFLAERLGTVLRNYRGVYFRSVRDDLRDVFIFFATGPDYPVVRNIRLLMRNIERG